MRMLSVEKVIDQYGWAYDFVGREQSRYSPHHIFIRKYDDVIYDDVDVIYFHSPNIDPSINVTAKIAKEKGIKVMGGYGGNPAYWNPGVANSYDVSDLLISISPQTYKFVREMFPNIPSVFLPECVDTNFFVPGKLNSNSFNVGWAGSRLPIKRINILEQLKYYVIKQSDWGMGYFVKNRPQDTMLKFFNQLNVFVLTSLSECMPRVVLEAMSCFPENTLVSVDGAIENTSKKYYSGKLLKIEAEDSIVYSTPNHPFFTVEGWKLAEELTTNDIVCINNEVINETRTKIKNCIKSVSCNEKRGFGLFSRNNRWRGNIDFQKRRDRTKVCSSNSNSEYIVYFGKMVKKILHDKIWFEIKKATLKSKGLLGFCDERVSDFASIKSFASLSKNQEQTLWNFDFIYSVPPTEKLWRYLHSRRMELLQTNKKIKFKRVTEIVAENFNGFVYNLKTDSGVYYANGFLVHNCGLPVISTNVGSLPLLLDKEWIVPVNPEDEVVDCINKKLDLLKKDLELQKKVGERNRKFVQENFSWEKMQPMWDICFENLVNNNIAEILFENKQYIDRLDKFRKYFI